jgi:hypothetical protein
MIKLRNLICEVIAERMTYDQLMSVSDPKRVERSDSVSVKPLIVRSINDREAWKFSYKTAAKENTTGLRHQGLIYFFKDDIRNGENALQLECSVDCSCPDFKFRFAYNNHQQDAGEIGSNSLNKAINRAPQVSLGPGLCKHIISLKSYLQTEVEAPVPTPTEPTAEPTIVPKSLSPKIVAPEEEPEEEPEVDPTIAPDPDKDNEPNEEPEIEPGIDKTQAPQEPTEEEPEDNPNDPEEEPDKKQKELKESGFNKEKIINTLNRLCEKKYFVVK